MRLNILAMALAASALTGLRAQEARYMWDFGASLGMSGYTGDANEGFAFRHPGVHADIFGRYNFNSRWSGRLQAGVNTISGNTADMDNALPGGAAYKFTATVADVALRGEFNFFPYGMGETYKRLRRWTPYVGLGVGVVMSSVDSRSYASLTLPIAAGVRYKPSERLNLGLELTMNKTLSDNLDGRDLADPYGIKSSLLKNTDMYWALGVSVSYEFGERCETCHRID
ncbi:MAG: porin family protein [Paramuribaculum sp.]|nr:porin family protein [Paramuribaculum sp.]